MAGERWRRRGQPARGEVRAEPLTPSPLSGWLRRLAARWNAQDGLARLADRAGASGVEAVLIASGCGIPGGVDGRGKRDERGRQRERVQVCLNVLASSLSQLTATLQVPTSPRLDATSPPPLARGLDRHLPRCSAPRASRGRPASFDRRGCSCSLFLVRTTTRLSRITPPGSAYRFDSLDTPHVVHHHGRPLLDSRCSSRHPRPSNPQSFLLVLRPAPPNSDHRLRHPRITCASSTLTIDERTNCGARPYRRGDARGWSGYLDGRWTRRMALRGWLGDSGNRVGVGCSDGN